MRAGWVQPPNRARGAGNRQQAPPPPPLTGVHIVQRCGDGEVGSIVLVARGAGTGRRVPGPGLAQGAPCYRRPQAPRSSQRQHAHTGCRRGDAGSAHWLAGAGSVALAGGSRSPRSPRPNALQRDERWAAGWRHGGHRGPIEAGSEQMPPPRCRRRQPCKEEVAPGPCLCNCNFIEIVTSFATTGLLPSPNQARLGSQRLWGLASPALARASAPQTSSQLRRAA